MTEQIMKAAHALGDLIKNDPITLALDHAMEDYERCDELMALIGEYNAQQEVMMSSAEAAGSDPELREKLTARIEEVYNSIINHPIYVAYGEAKQNFDALYTEVMGEVQFGITGERPCAHDCSSCGGCH